MYLKHEKDRFYVVSAKINFAKSPPGHRTNPHKLIPQ